MKILVCDPIHPDGVQALRSAGFDVDEKPSIDKAGLLNVANQYDALVIRGRTKIDAAILDSAPGLKISGRAGVGLDNVDLHSTNVAELTVGLMLTVLRRIPFADRKMKEGQWVKNQLMGEELQGKRVGVI